ncbi:MAG: LON peptidase substrate-binding domain-containing protein [Cryomorphaceae bacterium]
MQKTQLALFPLQLFLLPGETTKLHIFEERYQQLLSDCEDVQISFGIPFTENGTLTGYGSMVNVKKVISRNKNGSADIEIEAIGIFKVERFYMRMGEKLYPGGDVVIIDQENTPLVSNTLFSVFNAYMLESDTPIAPESFSADLNLLHLARMLNLADSKKIQLLKLKSTAAMERFLLSEIKMRSLLLKQRNSIEHNIFLN